MRSELMSILRTAWDSKPALWALLALPAAILVWRAASEGEWFDIYVPPSGEWSARFLIAALAIGPLAALFPRRGWTRWLLARRRSFGVAAFGYAALHLGFYMLDMESAANMLAELGATGIWTGWAAFFLLLPLVATSNDAAVRALGRGWKRLQRLAYPAAILALVHWITVHDDLAEALAWSAPLVLLRLWQAAASTAKPLFQKETFR